MNLSGPFIRRPIGTILLALGVFVCGVIAYFQLGVASLPNLEFPVIFVVANQPGASAENMATTVAAPLERHMGQIAGVNSMGSHSKEGRSSVILFFDFDKEIDGAARDVQAAINAALPDLPSGLNTAPIYRKANPNNDPVLLLSLTSKSHTAAELYNMADSLLSQRVRQLPGVADVTLAGGATPAVRVDVDLGKLTSMGLSTDQVRNAIAAANVTSPQGFLSDGKRMMTIAANGALTEGSQFADLIVAIKNGVPIHLRDIATVGDGSESKDQAAWFNGKRSILMAITKQSTANVIETVDSIYAQLPLMRSWLPEGVELTPFFDRTATIRSSIHEVQITMAISVTLVILTMLLFLRRIAPTVIAGLSVPLSLSSAFIVMYMFDFTLDNLTLMALIISIGFVVDDAIVVIENVVRHLDMGKTRLQAALDGAREIGFTIVSITASLVAVFLPLLFMGGFMGMMLHSFAVTIAAAIVMSAVVSLTLTASLCGTYLQSHKEENPSRLVQRIDVGHAWMLRAYTRLLDWSLHHPKTMSLQPLVLVLLTIWLTGFLKFGFVPEQDTGMIQGTTVASASISYESMVELQRKVADIVAADPAVDSLGSSLGGGGFRAGSNRGSLYINLKPLGEGRDLATAQVMRRIAKKAENLAGVQLRLRPVQDLGGGGPRGGDSSYSYSLKGSNYDDLITWGPKLAAELRKLPQFTNVSTELDEGGIAQNLIIDRDTASRLGVSIGAIDSTLYNAFGERQISTIYSDLNQYRVVLNAVTGSTPGLDTLSSLHVRANNGAMVPLSTLTRIEAGIAPLSVGHDFQFPVFDVNFNLAENVSMGEASSLIDQTVLNMRMPGGIKAEGGGNFRRFSDQQDSQGLLILFAILAVYLVLGILYESLIHPVTILSTLPAAGVGALLAMLVTNTELSVVSVIAIVLLIGIVKKNAIMMIDFALSAEREGGKAPIEAIREACLVRFRPIMMTSMVAILGAFPLAIGFGVGSEMRQPLGIAMIGGLLVSQSLTLFSTPALYLVFARISQRRRERKAARLAARNSALSTSARPG
ncbi:MAG TPA: efflux RND transporter permease subunit [Dokdonella sp.]|uniref:efflux RND transporter permease subunit n=1 Tax=Dokdonella sp. TaxID=2291710 RepID=UPI002D800E70|nr:efflux RND transporter permease subunit [Dokdonella sp.]HET9034052.1 efflux RND transporter permease subunit [Dokdonella sp.]